MKHIKLYEDTQPESDIRDYFFDLIDDDIDLEINSLNIPSRTRKFKVRQVLELSFSRNQSRLSFTDVSNIIDHLVRVNKMGEFIVTNISIIYSDDIGYTKSNFSLGETDDMMGLIDDLSDNINFEFKANLS